MIYLHFWGLRNVIYWHLIRTVLKLLWMHKLWVIWNHSLRVISFKYTSDHSINFWCAWSILLHLQSLRYTRLILFRFWKHNRSFRIPWVFISAVLKLLLLNLIRDLMWMHIFSFNLDGLILYLLLTWVIIYNLLLEIHYGHVVLDLL